MFKPFMINDSIMMIYTNMAIKPRLNAFSIYNIGKS